jgi:hypothetical protein
MKGSCSSFLMQIVTGIPRQNCPIISSDFSSFGQPIHSRQPRQPTPTRRQHDQHLILNKKEVEEE